MTEINLDTAISDLRRTMDNLKNFASWREEKKAWDAHDEQRWAVLDLFGRMNNWKRCKQFSPDRIGKTGGNKFGWFTTEVFDHPVFYRWDGSTKSGRTRAAIVAQPYPRDGEPLRGAARVAEKLGLAMHTPASREGELLVPRRDAHHRAHRARHRREVVTRANDGDETVSTTGEGDTARWGRHCAVGRREGENYKAKSRKRLAERIAMTQDEFIEESEHGERAERIAKYLVRSGKGFRGRLYLTVLEEKTKPVPFEWHWKRKNLRGVMFEPDDAARAEAWVKCTLLAGYTVFHS